MKVYHSTINTLGIAVCVFVVLSPTPLFAQRFNERTDRGELSSDSLTEASGIAASQRNPRFLYIHNDSGDDSRVFIANEFAQIVGSLKLLNATNRDWEDIAVGPGPEIGKTYVYVGDIGDNSALYPNKKIYRFEEPVFDTSNGYFTNTITEIDSIVFTLSDTTRDAETLMIDPQTRDIYVVTKREDSVRVYVLPFPQSRSMVAEFVLQLPFSSAVAGDISPTGNEILIKNYATVFYFRRESGVSIKSALATIPRVAPYQLEPQGEAICFDHKGDGFYTTSEETAFKIPSHLFYYSSVGSSEKDERDLELPMALEFVRPNPGKDLLEVTFSIRYNMLIRFEAVDNQGKVISFGSPVEFYEGEQLISLSTRELLTGNYRLLMKANGLTTSVPFEIVR